MYRKAGAQDRQRPADIDPLEYAQPQLFRFLENKMWIDELYARTIIAFSWMSARLSDWMDRHFWDRLVRGVGAIGELFGTFTASVDERGINPGVDETTVGTRGLGRLMSAAHSGQIQTYLASHRDRCTGVVAFLRMVGLISALILIPLVGVLALFTAPQRNARPIALLVNALAAFDALVLWRHFDIAAAGMQMVERHAWIPAIGAEYLVGIDGLSLLLVLLTSLIVPFAFLAQKMDRGFCAMMLIMQSALYGTFTAQNFRSLVLVLRDEPDPGVPADQNLGRRKSRPRCDQIFPVHVSRKCGDVAGVPGNLFGQGHIRFCHACWSW